MTSKRDAREPLGRHPASYRALFDRLCRDEAVGLEEVAFDLGGLGDGHHRHLDDSSRSTITGSL